MSTYDLSQRVTTTDTTLTVNDCAVWVDASEADRMVMLPEAAGNGGQRYEIKKVDVSTHTVKIAAVGGEKIDGENILVLSIPNQAVVLTCDNIGWQAS